MSKLVILLIFALGLVHLVKAALTDEEVIQLLEGTPIKGYDVDPIKNGLPASTSAFIILNYDDHVIDGIWNILESPEQQQYWKSAFIDFRRIATADPTIIDFARLVERTESIEQSKTIEEADKAKILFFAYGAIARHRNDRAFDFLKARTMFEFWEENEISRTVYQSHGESSRGILQTGQALAIGSIQEIQNEKAYDLLESLLADERYSGAPHLNLKLHSLLEGGGWEASADRLKTITAEYAKRLELRSVAGSIQVTE